MSMGISFFTPASQGARVCLFLSMPLNGGPHRIPIIGMESNSALSRFIGTVLRLAHPDYRDHADAFNIGHE